MSTKMEVQKWLISLLTDPIAKILMRNSTLTKTQIETLLIDILTEKVTERRIGYDQKARLRLLKSGVSRGAFNRTLKQARNNVIKSMYTVILLGYLGILESPRLEPYLEVSNRLHTYTEAYRSLWKDKEAKSEHIRMVKMLQKELERGLKQLIESKSLSERT